MAEYKRKTTGRLVPCPGEAHSNPHIDNCLLCAPRWGLVEEETPVNFALAQKRRQDVPFPMLTEDEYDIACGYVERGEASITEVHCKSSYYLVLRWEPRDGALN